jgi:hypothetical protein
MASQSKDPAQIVVKSRARVVKAGHLPVSEVAADRCGAASPFGDDINFPVSPDALTYHHPVIDPSMLPAGADR